MNAKFLSKEQDTVSETFKAENINENINEEASDKVIGEETLKFVSNFIPVLTQVLLYDGVGHVNFRTIILKKIEDYKKDFKNNQYKLFLLYFLLIDTDIKTNKSFVDEIFEFVTLSPLKVSTFFKLNFYLTFKSYNKKELEEYFKLKTKQAQIRMNNKSDSDKMNRELSKSTKRNIAKKGRK